MNSRLQTPPSHPFLRGNFCDSQSLTHSSKRAVVAEKKYKDILDMQTLVKLQASIEKSIGNASKDVQATHMEILSKILKGEKVSPENLAAIQPRESTPDINPIYKTVQLDASGKQT